MGIESEKYIRKPLYVDAVRITEENFNDVVKWCDGTVEVEETKGNAPNRHFIRLRVKNPMGARQTKGFVGDWILWNEQGGYKIYTHKAFLGAFEQAQQSTHPSVAETISTPATPIETVATPVEPLVLTENEVQTAIADDQPMAQEFEDVPDTSVPVEPTPAPDLSPPEEDEEPRLQTETSSDGKLKHEPVVSDSPTAPPQVHEGKRILTREEQRLMPQDEVRELLRSGEAVLEQDVAA